jgi:hypothetical protein
VLLGLPSSRTATESDSGTLNVMRRAAVATIIAVIGIALAGCGSSTTSTSLSPRTSTVSQPPGQHSCTTGAGDADIVATVAATTVSSGHARHVSTTGPQAWEPNSAVLSRDDTTTSDRHAQSHHRYRPALMLGGSPLARKVVSAPTARASGVF